jgi:hypothetical protein
MRRLLIAFAAIVAFALPAFAQNPTSEVDQLLDLLVVKNVITSTEASAFRATLKKTSLASSSSVVAQASSVQSAPAEQPVNGQIATPTLGLKNDGLNVSGFVQISNLTFFASLGDAEVLVPLLEVAHVIRRVRPLSRQLPAVGRLLRPELRLCQLIGAGSSRFRTRVPIRPLLDRKGLQLINGVYVLRGSILSELFFDSVSDINAHAIPEELVEFANEGSVHNFPFDPRRNDTRRRADKHQRPADESQLLFQAAR